jgi:O-succinylbenzoic acid--CoA ligase
MVPLPLPRRARSDHPALICGAEVLSYRQLAARADELARRLAGLGLGCGDRLAVLLPNGPDFAALLHATARLQAILVPIHVRLAPAEVAWQVEHSGCGVLVYDPALADRVSRLPPRVRAVAASGVTGDGPALEDLPPSDVLLQAEVGLDMPATLLYTSGTTGRPKGAVLTHGNHLWSALGSALRLGQRRGDRWLVPLPFSHVGGLAVLLRCAWYGTTAVVSRDFEADAVARVLADAAITHVSLVPTMLARLLEARGDRPAPPRLRAVLLGGAAAPAELLAHAADIGFPLAPTYGLTEAASQVTTRSPGRGPCPEGGVGRPLAFTSLAIADDDGHALPAGQEGEILVRGPTVMAGYWRDAPASAAAVVDGWLRTGDLGRLGEDGELQVLARREDLIVTGGENVYPAEVEALLRQHPGVAECCVVGLPDPEWGAIVAAAVVPAAGAALDPAELQAFLRTGLAGYKLPRRILCLDALPRNAAGKLLRSEARERLLA